MIHTDEKGPFEVAPLTEVMRTMMGNFVLDQMLQQKKAAVRPHEMVKMMEETLQQDGQNLVAPIDTAAEREVIR